jgi:hypothetical protein
MKEARLLAVSGFATGWRACVPRSAPYLIATVWIAALAGCGMISKLTGADQKAEAEALKYQQLQLAVMRFADEYAGRIADPIQAFKRETNDAGERLAAQNWQLSQTTSAYTVASGPNPVANALDMVVLATLSRLVMEDSWVAEKYGERAVQLRDAHIALEPRAWALVDGILTDGQQAQLRKVIDDWRARNPHVRAVAFIHFHDFAKAIGQPRPDEARQPGSLFGLLGLDPLSNLDPAVREITQTRHLAERAIFYMQRAPNLIDMQIERLTYQFTSLPETKALLVDVERASLAAEAAGKLAGDLPAVIARERQAAIAQFTDALYAQESQMRELAVALRGTLEAGTATSDSLNATIRSLDALMKRFEKPEGARPEAEPAVPKKPFDIADYTQAAHEFSATARELQTLVATIDAGTPGLANLTQQATGDIKGVIDHLFWRLVLLVAIVIVLTVVAILVYRLIAHRVLPRHSHAAGSVAIDERKRA